MNSMTRSQPALRKAAIVISTLDTHSADSLLDKMPPETAELVRQMVVDLADIPTAEQDAVIREFMTAGGIVVNEALDGVELDPSLAEKLHSPNGYADHLGAPEMAQSAPPFGFLREATAEVLARHLERQHPQVIAVVTAHLPPQQAADVIKQFKPKLQADVLRRVAELDFADQEVLRDIERELELLLSDDLRMARNRQSGLAAISTILNAAGTQRNELLDNLSQHDSELATQVTGATVRLAERSRPATEHRSMAKRTVSEAMAVTLAKRPESRAAVSRVKAVDPQPEPTADEERDAANVEPSAAILGPLPEVAFEELTLLGDDDWAVLIRAAEPPIVLLALTGASEQLLRRITRRLTKREAQALRTRLQPNGPLRLSDIEHAQRHVAGLASRLIARGQIRLPERRSFAAAA